MPIVSTKHYFNIVDATADHLNLMLGLLSIQKVLLYFSKGIFMLIQCV